LVLGPDTLALTGNHQVFIAKYNCCSLEAAQYSSDTTIMPGSSVTLVASGGVAYMWSTGATTSSITVSPVVTTDYCVILADSGNCASSSCIRVNVEEECSSPVFIANAFSPNNDGANDYVRVHLSQPECVSEFYIAIYDRWGVKVFETYDPGFRWDGTYHGRAMFSQVLTYFIRTVSIGGNESLVKGNISLVL
jgi:gliding motility-associated-like protein